MQVTHLENQIFPSESSMRPYDPDLMNEEMKSCLWFCKKEKLWVSDKKNLTASKLCS